MVVQRSLHIETKARRSNPLILWDLLIQEEICSLRLQ